MLSSFQVTKNLTSQEIECPCCKDCRYDQKFVDYLQILRDIMQIPFVYSSFFRCKFYNDSLTNSSPVSKHLMGLACDIKTNDWTANQKWRFVRAAMGLGISCGLYSAHLHVDLRKGDPSLFYGSY